MTREEVVNQKDMNCVWYWWPVKQNWFAAELVPAYLGGTAKTLKELKNECERAGYKAFIGRKDDRPFFIPKD